MYYANIFIHFFVLCFYRYICIMDLKKFLTDNPMIKKAELARKMYPNVGEAPSMLGQKLTEASVGTGKQRINDTDKKKVKEVLTDHIKSCQKFIDSID